MDTDNPAIERDHIPDGNAKARLLTLDHLDGRTLAVKVVRQLEAAIAEDLGGAGVLSQAQRSLARRAAVLSAVIEDAEARWAVGEKFDLEGYITAVNALRRVLSTLGLRRKARDVPDLQTYLRQRAEAQS